MTILKVLMSQNLEELLPQLEGRYTDIEFVPIDAETRPETRHRDAQIIWRSAVGDAVFQDVLEHGTQLAWLQITAAGFDWLSGEALERRLAEGMVMTRSANSYDVPIAEYVMATILHFARSLSDLREAQERREWVRLTAQDFIGSTLTVMGTGAIGQEIAWRATALGAEVIGINRDGRAVPKFPRVVKSSARGSALAAADWVVLAAPLTSETRHYIGRQEFEQMKNSAVLINVGRGALVVEDELVRALETGMIAGAALDAFEEEPLPADSPLWDLPHTLVTPHTSFRASGNLQRLYADFCANLDRFLIGDPLDGQRSRPNLGY